jgi:hypothetical protein
MAYYLIIISGMKHRAPYVSKAGTSRYNPIPDAAASEYKPHVNVHCPVEGSRMVWVPTLRCYYCNVCGNTQDAPHDVMQQVREAENQANRRLFTTADGSRIFDSSRPGGENRFRFSPGGITIPMHSTTKKSQTDSATKMLAPKRCMISSKHRMSSCNLEAEK